MTEQQWRQDWLPLFPLASDDLLDGIYRTSRNHALERRYIEANPQSLSNLLVVDIDHDDAALRAITDRRDWLPNVVVENPRNGHAHAVWALREPVTRTEYARRKPLAFAASVTEGLRRSVDGDQAYSGLMTKNPIHESWNGYRFRTKLYDLDELAARLTDTGLMPPRSWNRTKHRNTIGLGRNCSIFESARTWAYPRVRDFTDRTPATSRALLNVIQTHVNELNAEFPEPLPHSEASAIARSIHKWITTKFDGWLDGHHVNQATFTKIQTARGRRSGAVRRAAKLEMMRSLIEGGTRA